MKTSNSQSLNVEFSSHVLPLTNDEMKTVKGGIDSYGNSIERICRFLMKLVYGN